jgi:hypothetical protein
VVRSRGDRVDECVHPPARVRARVRVCTFSPCRVTTPMWYTHKSPMSSMKPTAAHASTTHERGTRTTAQHGQLCERNQDRRLNARTTTAHTCAQDHQPPATRPQTDMLTRAHKTTDHPTTADMLTRAHKTTRHPTTYLLSKSTLSATSLPRCK